MAKIIPWNLKDDDQKQQSWHDDIDRNIEYAQKCIEKNPYGHLYFQEPRTNFYMNMSSKHEEKFLVFVIGVTFPFQKKDDLSTVIPTNQANKDFVSDVNKAIKLFINKYDLKKHDNAI